MATSGWAIDGPVFTEVAQARRLAYAATGGAEGVGGINDLVVRPLDPTPGPGFQISMGSALILSKYKEGETYQGSVTEPEVHATNPNVSSTQPRHDIVYMAVEDPFVDNSPYPIPAEPNEQEYFPIKVVENVPLGARRLRDVPGYENATGLTLWRIEYPPSTGTINGTMIKDLRQVAQPRRQRRLITLYPTEVHRAPRTNYSSWPLRSTDRPQIDIPIWATRARISCTVMGAKFIPGSGALVAGIRTGFSSTDPGQNTIIREDLGSSAGRHLYAVVGTHTIPPELRGLTDQLINIQTAITSAAGTGELEADYQTSVLIDIEFSEDL